MPAAFLHGVETIEIQKGPRPVRTVRSAVIGLIGTAPAGPLQDTALVLSETDAAQFGLDLPGFTIPAALDSIFTQGYGTVIVVNVLDPATHVTAITAETVVLDAADLGQLAFGAVKPETIVVKDSTATTTYVLNTDYTIVDAPRGRIKRKSGGAIAAGASLKVSYTYLDPSKVTPADLIGTVDGAGNRTGLQALKDTYNEFGFFAKLLIAPGYSPLQSVAAALVAMAESLGAMALIDLPAGATRDQAVAARGPGGAFTLNTSSERAVLCYPYLDVGGADFTALRPLSPYAAGVIAAKDFSRGYWWSPSNTEILGVIGTERKLSARIDDPQSDVNLLNEAGFVTVFNSFGTGLRLWGNRSAAWPSETALAQFIPVRRTGDIIAESIRYFSLQFIDMPLSNAVIDALVESVNGYLRKLQGDGALLGGLCWFDPARNPEATLAAGQLVLSYKYTPPPPLERLSFETEITEEFLLTLLPANQRG